MVLIFSLLIIFFSQPACSPPIDEVVVASDGSQNSKLFMSWPSKPHYTLKTIYDEERSGRQVKVVFSPIPWSDAEYTFILCEDSMITEWAITKQGIAKVGKILGGKTLMNCMITSSGSHILVLYKNGKGLVFKIWERETKKTWEVTSYKESILLDWQRWLFFPELPGDPSKIVVNVGEKFDILDLSQRKINPFPEFSRNECQSLQQVISDDGKYLAALCIEGLSSSNPGLYVWDFTTGKRLVQYGAKYGKKPFTEFRPQSIWFQTNANNLQLVSYGEKNLAIFETTAWQVDKLFKHETRQGSYRVVKRGFMLVFPSDKELILVDLLSGQEKKYQPKDFVFNGFDVSHDGKVIVGVEGFTGKALLVKK